MPLSPTCRYSLAIVALITAGTAQAGGVMIDTRGADMVLGALGHAGHGSSGVYLFASPYTVYEQIRSADLNDWLSDELGTEWHVGSRVDGPGANIGIGGQLNDYLALELSITSARLEGDSDDDDGDTHLSYFHSDFALLPQIPLGNLGALYAKAGVQYFRFDVDNESDRDRLETVEGMAGVGVAIGRNSPMGVRIGYDYNTAGLSSTYVQLMAHF